MRQIFSFILINTWHKGHFTETVCAKKVTALLHRTIFFALTILIFLITDAEAIAETYYSQGNVPVNIPASWNTLPAGGGSAPADFTGTHTWIIQTGHDMTITGDWIVGGTATVSVEGIMTVSGIYTVAITGTLTVNGTLTNSGTHDGTSGVTASGGITVNGSYNHARNGGVIPTATWAVTSDCNIIGITTIAPTIPSATQPLGNFTWLCASQVPDVDLNGQLSGVHGNLNIVSTGAGTSALLLGDSQPGDLTVDGDFLQTGGRFFVTKTVARQMTVNGNFRFEGTVFYISIGVGPGILNVGGSFLVTGGYFNFMNTSGPGTLNVTRNCSITGGEFRMSKSVGTGTMNIAGNFTHTGGLIYEESTGSGSIVFNGNYDGTTGMQTYTSGGTVNNSVNFTVNSGAYLKMAAVSTTITGAGTFTLSSGGTLGVTSTAGITTTGASGNIQVSGTRTFSAGANYIYNGTVPQVTGTGLTQNIPANLTVNNSAGVTLSSETTILGVLTLSDGILNTGSYALVLDNSATGSINGSSSGSYINGTLRRNIADGANTYTFPIGTSSNYAPVSLAFGTGTATGYLNGSTTDGDHASIITSDINADKTVNRTWSFSVSGGLGNLTCDATFNWVPADQDAGFDYATAIIGRYSTSAWTYPTQGPGNETSVIATGLTGFGDFQVGNAIETVNEPTIQATGVTFYNVSAIGMTITWTNGNGARRIVLMKSGSAVDSDPVDRTSYTASTTFGDGSQISTGNYVVYNGTGSSVDITGLSPATTYYVAVYEFNGPVGHEDYLITNPATGSQQSAAVGQYRSAGNGNWGDNTAWEFLDGSTWVAATSTPAYIDDQILIQNGHTISVASDVTVDQLTIETGGQVTVSSGVNLTVADGLNADFIVSGTLYNSGTVTTAGVLHFDSGSVYEHAQNGGTIPVATWDVDSDCNITGITTTAPTIPSATQPFGNFTWNCPLQDPVNDIFLHGQLTRIAGDLNIISTHGTDSGLKLGDTVSGDLTVNGDFVQTGGRFHLAYALARKMTVNGDFYLENGIFYITAFTGTGTLDVRGNFYINGGYFSFINYWLVTGTLNVTGNCSIAGGEFRMSKSTGTGILNLTGDFSHTGGLIWEESTGSGSIVFNGTYNGTTGMQTYTSGGTITENINFTVNNGAYLKMAAASTTITGGGTFTLSPGGTLGITSAEGIAATGASGNIQVTGTRTFNSGANYIYNGIGAQITGDGLPLTVNSLNTGGSSILSLTNNPIGELPLTVTSSMNIGSGTTLVIDDPDTSDPQAVTVAGTLYNDGIIIINSDAVNSNGSLVVNASAESTGIVTYNRVMPGSLYRYISSPVSSASLPSGRTYWLWNEPTGAWVETTACESGRGYTMQTSGSTVSFNGSIVTSSSQTGTAPYNSFADHYTDQRTSTGGQWGGGGWNLLGNPFTSAMDALAFIDHNNGIIDVTQEDNSFDPSYEAVYIYNGSGYYYIAPGKTGYEGLGAFPTYTDIQAGQGFFALANFQGVSFNFTSVMQTHNTSTPMTKSAEAEENPWPGLQLKVKYGDNENSTLIVYSENMTAGLDPGYDVGQLSSGPDVEIYTTLVVKDNSVNFARQALPVTDCDKNIIPVGIDSEKGGEVTFSAYTVPLSNYKFWLEDRTTGIYTDLNTSAYTVTLPAKTYGTGRFFIIASTNIPTGINDLTEEAGSELRIWTSDDKVIIKGEVSDRAICEIYDITGRKIMTARLNDGELNTLTLPSSQGGFYIVRVLDGGKVTTHKVAIL